MRQSRSSRPFLTLPSLLAVAGLIAACGARGPLELEVVDVLVTPDASATNTTPGQTDGGPGTSSSDDAGGGSTGPGTGTGPGIPGLSDDGGILSCGTCVAGQCGSSIATCFADPTCATSLECILTTCLAGGAGGAGGGGGLSCFTTCAGSSGITTLLPILTCIAGTCGTDCGSLLGGLGGF